MQTVLGILWNELRSSPETRQSFACDASATREKILKAIFSLRNDLGFSLPGKWRKKRSIVGWAAARNARVMICLLIAKVIALSNILLWAKNSLAVWFSWRTIKTNWASISGNSDCATCALVIHVPPSTSTPESLGGPLTVFGGETCRSNRDGVTRVGAVVGDVATTPVNSVPWSRWREESNGFRFFVLIFSQMITCFMSVSGANFREHTGHKSRRRLGGGISMKISLSCWCSSGTWLRCCSGW